MSALVCNPINFTRRAALMGLVASATVATATVEVAAVPAENPELINLAEKLPEFISEYVAARDAYNNMERAWNSATPLAPDEVTVPGGSSKPAGRPERTALNSPLIRDEERFPRFIVLEAWQVDGQIFGLKRGMRKAKKRGAIAECLWLEEEIKRLKKLSATVWAYEKQYRDVRTEAHAEHDRLWPAYSDARKTVEKRVSAIMDTPDWTISGVLIKARALAEWDRVTIGTDRLMLFHDPSWCGKIAASVLRHTGGGLT